MTTVDDAEIGSLYRRKVKAEKRLLKRKNDAKQLVEPLRILAECFDEENQDVNIETVENDDFWYWFQDQNSSIKNSRGVKDPPVKFPMEAQKIAQEICELKKEIEDLTEQLDLTVECL